MPAVLSASPRPTVAPGLLVAGAGTLAALAAAHLVPEASPLLVAIVLGVAVANAGLPTAAVETLGPGMGVASKHLLRVGVALLGLQLAVSDLAALGWGTALVAATVVVAGIGGSLALGRSLGVGWTQRLLIACGFSICGAAAAAAVDSVIDSRTRELVTTVALVVVFGTAMIPLVPLVAEMSGLDTRSAGLWAGAAIHEVAQVVATGTALDAAAGGALAVAVTVKLARVALLAPVIAIVGVVARRRGEGRTDGKPQPIVPLFLLGFLACVAVRSTGVLGPFVVDVAHSVQTALLTAAMFALGTGVRPAVLRGVGWRPVALAAAATIWIAGIALAGVLVISAR
ncbi:YeiH family protein [Rhodococcus sp. CH91]|uniref:YeiH family protein n=1 Tax=Rhodococcus sp. CH91 TaxID=2910256 RepID=UPI001F4A177C|nr:putative sulfate exporter family transporter [Rhodococcus sp. CH91]